ncbi:hypothetical protein Z945_938 [Sulfitobacter noctilucae]|nr:hypothetical protein [Sulfitobacter noctilucae]KIN65891.1 hypothetical protein Z945_938 [Sulfitobacter noctilucae]
MGRLLLVNGFLALYLWQARSAMIEHDMPEAGGPATTSACSFAPTA